jgi:hypothetical protein
LPGIDDAKQMSLQILAYLTNLTNIATECYDLDMNVNIYEAKTKLSHLVGLVQAGEEVIINVDLPAPEVPLRSSPMSTNFSKAQSC